MDFRHIFLPHPRFFSNQKLGRTQGEKGKQNKKQKNPKRSILHDTAVEKCLNSRNEACHCSALETIIQLPVFAKETVKFRKRNTTNLFSWLKDRTSVLQNKKPESTEHNFP